MDSLYMKGELLQVTTKNSEVYEGHFYSITSDKSKISLYNVKELPQGNECEGITHYYNSEVTNIVKLQKADIQKHLKISEKECELIINIAKKYIFINQVDNSFQEALEDLNQYSYVSVSSDGAAMGRKCKMPFLVMATPQQIYIFDIQVMQYRAFEAGLQKLLESEYPKKIVHDCRKLSDCLYHKHNVKLSSVFDTQVGDLIIQRNKQGRLPETVKSLSECLNTYLGLQLNAIEEKLDILQCTVRPLSASIKDTIAKNIAFMHRLSEIINEEMMLPFVRGVECFVENLRSSDDFKAWELCGKHHQIPKDFKSAIEY
ncbi:piRNA biogenesis protein EXD1-like [Leguminivora glycinivorella]|uniref:piRNA biogenesis protein EXD1-like n=1 Tax=Leguminivora glycinivorella TaxID=1035111 RepID=UPI00200F80C4|nr:piRNA biogenesis protein EXD1-like [Leguminivora glycinivorella]